MTSITGVHHVSFSVTDLDRSARWYCDMLGFAEDALLEGEGFVRVRLRRPDCPVVLTLTCHAARTADSFDEHHPGLDHLAFQVGTVADVEAWYERFVAAGVAQSEIQRTPDGDGARLTFRDPDDIQLELFSHG